MGARKPHIPKEFELAPGENIVKVLLQWDTISMRYAKLTTSLGRELEWGFKDVAGATTAVSEPPVPGAYLAAFRGFEGKPRPVAKKRCGRRHFCFCTIAGMTRSDQRQQWQQQLWQQQQQLWRQRRQQL